MYLGVTFYMFGGYHIQLMMFKFILNSHNSMCEVLFVKKVLSDHHIIISLFNHALV